ncbi:MAG TPA: methyl-accepting chemotaxis protein [bacterium]|nr:methyl-accepting chemotaxis protein [bacterium]
MKLDFQKRIVYPLLIALGLLLGISAFLVGHAIYRLKSEQVLMESRSVVQSRAREIETFLTDRARIPLTVFRSPFVLDWFASYDQYRKPILHDQEYQKLVLFFRRLVISDPAIKSVFFATENTGEYFDQDGRFEQAGYDAKERPWWQSTLEKGRLYCDLSGIDYEDSTHAATLQMPVYREDGRLLGVAGVDISIETIANVLSRVRYHGLGEPFLIDEDGHIIEFPSMTVILSWLERLNDLEGKVPGSKGLSVLAQAILSEGEGHTRIVWRDKKQIAFYTHVTVPEADVRWRLGLIVPERVLTTPVYRWMAVTVMVAVFMIAVILVFSFRITTSTVRPLGMLASRLHHIAHEECDLTLEIPVHSTDAVGETARNFNALMARLRELLRVVIINTRDVASGTRSLKGQSTIMTREAGEMSHVIGLITNVSKKMVETIESIGKAADNVAILSKNASEQMGSAEKSVSERIREMVTINGQLQDMQKKMDRMNHKSDNIEEAMRMIDDVNKQIGLLSVNAAIEAVNAGELGKGFAVIAEEIQRMNTGTEEANKHNKKLIGEFRSEFHVFHERIQTICDQVSSEVGSFRDIEKTFQALLKSIRNSDLAAARLREHTQAQMKAIHEIKLNLQQIETATSVISETITRSVEMINGVDARVIDLNRSTEVFKIEENEGVHRLDKELV